MNNTETACICCYGDKKYYLDIKKILDFVNYSNAHPIKESEIIDTYQNDEEGETNDEQNTFGVSSKVIRETTSYGIAQIDNIRYDLIKTFIQQILDFGYDENEKIDCPPFGFRITLNTLIKEGFLKEI